MCLCLLILYNFFLIWIVNLCVGVIIIFWIDFLCVFILFNSGNLNVVVFFVFVCVCLIIFLFCNVCGIVLVWIGVVFLKFIFLIDCSKELFNFNFWNVVNVIFFFLFYIYYLKKGVFWICGKVFFLNVYVYKWVYIFYENIFKCYYILLIISFVCVKSKFNCYFIFIFRVFFFIFIFLYLL